MITHENAKGQHTSFQDIIMWITVSKLLPDDQHLASIFPVWHLLCACIPETVLRLSPFTHTSRLRLNRFRRGLPKCLSHHLEMPSKQKEEGDMQGHKGLPSELLNHQENQSSWVAIIH